MKLYMKYDALHAPCETKKGGCTTTGYHDLGSQEGSGAFCLKIYVLFQQDQFLLVLLCDHSRSFVKSAMNVTSLEF